MEKTEIAFPMEKKELLLAWRGITCPVVVSRLAKSAVYWFWKATEEQETKGATVEMVVFLLLLQRKTLRRGEPFTPLFRQEYQAGDYAASFLVS